MIQHKRDLCYLEPVPVCYDSIVYLAAWWVVGEGEGVGIGSKVSIDDTSTWLSG